MSKDDFSPDAHTPSCNAHKTGNRKLCTCGVCNTTVASKEGPLRAFTIQSTYTNRVSNPVHRKSKWTTISPLRDLFEKIDLSDREFDTIANLCKHEAFYLEPHIIIIRSV